jgi:site-specific recombinase XerC
MVTVNVAMDKYIESISLARSKHTTRAYRNGMKSFIETLSSNGVSPDADISAVDEDAITLFSVDLKRLSTATEALYTTACQFAGVSVPTIRGNAVPAIFGNTVPP